MKRAKKKKPHRLRKKILTALLFLLLMGLITLSVVLYGPHYRHGLTGKSGRFSALCHAV